jgi:threonine/homoserine/homoserine lactone efflux protein
MRELLPAWPALAGFLLASFALAATPGPGVAYIVTRTLAHGRRAGLASVGGVALGNFANCLGASLGLAALFAVSSIAFTLIKLAGAAYLIHLGIAALRAPTPAMARGGSHAHGLNHVIRDGFMVALLNPKTALFFAAFLPQFIDPTAAPSLQTIMLGTSFVLIAAGTDSAYVLAASAGAPVMARIHCGRAAGRLVTAAIFIGLGVVTAVPGILAPLASR